MHLMVIVQILLILNRPNNMKSLDGIGYMFVMVENRGGFLRLHCSLREKILGNGVD